MLDSGFIGHFPASATVPLALQCRLQDLQVASPSVNPTFKIIDPDGSVIENGELTKSVSGLTGFRMSSLDLSSKSSWQPGVLYTVIFNYEQGGNMRAAMSTFQVV